MRQESEEKGITKELLNHKFKESSSKKYTYSSTIKYYYKVEVTSVFNITTLLNVIKQLTIANVSRVAELNIPIADEGGMAAVVNLANVNIVAVGSLTDSALISKINRVLPNNYREMELLFCKLTFEYSLAKPVVSNDQLNYSLVKSEYTDNEHYFYVWLDSFFSCMGRSEAVLDVATIDKANSLLVAEESLLAFIGCNLVDVLKVVEVDDSFIVFKYFI